MRPLSVVLCLLFVAILAAAALLGAWIDGRRQALRNKGLHPVTTPEGRVESQEAQQALSPSLTQPRKEPKDGNRNSQHTQH